MSIDTNFDSNGSGTPGSPSSETQAGPDNISGQPATTGGKNWESVAEQALKDKTELERVLGTQGGELGEYRDYIESLKPLLDILQENPEIVDAVMENKLTSELAKAIREDKVTIKEAQQAAQQVAQASAAVHKDLGKDAKNIDPAEIERLVSEKVGLVKKEVLEEVSERESDKEFESRTMNFIERTADFEKYAEDIVKFLEDNPDQTDISIAYNAVRGQKSVSESRADSDRQRAETAKNLAMNASGGGSTSADTITQKNLVDQLIAGTARNRFN